MEERNIALTKEGYEKLDEELKYLKGPKKMEVAESLLLAVELDLMQLFVRKLCILPLKTF